MDRKGPPESLTRNQTQRIPVLAESGMPLLDSQSTWGGVEAGRETGGYILEVVCLGKALPSSVPAQEVSFLLPCYGLSRKLLVKLFLQFGPPFPAACCD